MTGFSNIMIDLETLGSRAGCIPLSVGAVAFDVEHGIGPHFHCVINTASCEKRYGLHRNPATETWWRGQSEEARRVLKEAEESKIGLADAMSQLTAFFKPFDPWRVKAWGNGSDFDISILTHCYAVVDREAPWKFWNARCLRTLKDLAGAGKKSRAAVAHDALTDAMDQAHEAIALMKRLRITEDGLCLQALLNGG